MPTQQETNWKQMELDNEQDAELLQDDLTDEQLLELSNRVEARYASLTKDYKKSDAYSDERKAANSSVRALRAVLGEFDLAKYKVGSKLGAKELELVMRCSKAIRSMPFVPAEEEKIRDMITDLVFKDGRRHISEEHEKIQGLRRMYKDQVALNTLRYLGSNERNENRDGPVIARLQGYMEENSLSPEIAAKVQELSI